MTSDELRRLGSHLRKYYAADGQLRGAGIALQEAADELDRLRIQLDALQSEGWRAYLDSQIAELRAENARLREERDGAVTVREVLVAEAVNADVIAERDRLSGKAGLPLEMRRIQARD